MFYRFLAKQGYTLHHSSVSLSGILLVLFSTTSLLHSIAHGHLSIVLLHLAATILSQSV